MGFWRKWARGDGRAHDERDEKLRRRVNALFSLLSDVYGREKLVLKAGKLDALDLMQSSDVREQVLALERIVFEDPTLEECPSRHELPGVLDEIEEMIADILARRDVEERLEQRIAEKMQERHEEYVKELKLQVLREDGGPDNAHTLKKYAELEKLEQRKLTASILKSMRPTSIDEVVGQESAKKALFSKVASPFPQHVLVYGPPGVGKTTVARLALEYAKTLPFTPFDPEAKFVEVDGTTLRWDPREVTNPLLGSVHDPIYQGARRDFAEASIPEPKTGLVTEAHGGVLFIDEIGEMDPILQNKLLKVLEDKRVYFDSSYYDPSDPNIPKYIRKLFEEGAPADFVLIGATTRDPSEISPALRSRCAEVFFDPLTPKEVETIVRQSAARLNATLEEGVAELISEYTVEGRKATTLLADAYGLALHDMQAGLSGDVLGDGEVESAKSQDRDGEEGVSLPRVHIRVEHLLEVIRTARLAPSVVAKGSSSMEVGHVFGLGVAGFLGSVLEIEAVAFKAREPGKGQLRFNQTAGSMAKDSVFNAASVVRRVMGEDLSNWDVHVNVVGGGRIDGPSAGAAVVLAIVSALQERPIRQDIAVTGEISIQGRIKPVGGVYEKLFGAKQAGISCVLVPEKNALELPKHVAGVTAIPVRTIEEAMEIAFSTDLQSALKHRRDAYRSAAAVGAQAVEGVRRGVDDSKFSLDAPARRPVKGSG